MVKRVLLSMAIILILLTTSVFAVTGKVTGSKVRIREKADIKSIEVSVAKKDEIVNVIGEEGDWYKVQFENVTGYMSKEYVDTDYKAGDQDKEPDLTPSTTPNDQEQTPEPETPTTQIDNPPETDEISDNVTPETPAETETPAENETPSDVTENNETEDLGKNQKVTFESETDLRYLPNFTSRTR